MRSIYLFKDILQQITFHLVLSQDIWWNYPSDADDQSDCGSEIVDLNNECDEPEKIAETQNATVSQNTSVSIQNVILTDDKPKLKKNWESCME